MLRIKEIYLTLLIFLESLDPLAHGAVGTLPSVGHQYDEVLIPKAYSPPAAAPTHRRFPRSSGTTEFAVFIDAGSSGSRVWIYTWSTTLYDSAGFPTISSTGHKKIEPGLSVQTDQEIKQTLIQLVDFAKTNIPEDLQAETPIYLLATAGLRTLPEDRANSAIDFAYETLKDKSLCPFQVYNKDSVRILSGEEEGVFMWIAVNYLSGKLKPPKAGELDETLGIIELGGASTQLAFIPRGILLANKFAMDVSKVRYSLYVHSYLDYGQELVINWIQNNLINKNPGQQRLDNPCMLRGQTEESKSKTFVGTSNPDECVAMLEEMVYKVEPDRCHPKPCAIGTIYQPSVPVQKTFYALGAFAPVLQNVKAAKIDEPINFATVRQKAKEFCSKEASEIPGLYPRVESRYITKSCVTSLYFNVLLIKGYGFSEDSNKIFINEKVEGKDIDWTLGALLYERFTHPGIKASAVVSGAERTGQSTSFMIMAAVILCFSRSMITSIQCLKLL